MKLITLSSESPSLVFEVQYSSNQHVSDTCFGLYRPYVYPFVCT